MSKKNLSDFGQKNLGVDRIDLRDMERYLENLGKRGVYRTVIMNLTDTVSDMPPEFQKVRI